MVSDLAIMILGDSAMAAMMIMMIVRPEYSRRLMERLVIVEWAIAVPN